MIDDLRDDRWWESALCAQVDPELWYPEKGGSVREAVAMCGRCPVTAPCLEETLRIEVDEAGQPTGVRGGLTAKQREPLIRQYRKATAKRESVTLQRIRRLAAAGVPPKDIARELGMNPDAVSARLSRAAKRDAKRSRAKVGEAA